MLNASIKDIPLPRRMARRPVNDKGFPVPYFVAKVNGEWDFRAFSGEAISACVLKRLCWLCGEPLGRYLAFVIGPMCAINRISSEPPSHLECAQYAVMACPFLTKPRMRRNEVDLPVGQTAGIALDHNPGATLIWITKGYHPVSDNKGGVLFQIHEPHDLLWYAEGRPATRDQVLTAFNKGLPFLREVAASHDGPEGSAELERRIGKAMTMLPVE
jgi:hypothetical protein